MDAGKIKLSPEDAQAVREVADKANAAQGDRYPEACLNSSSIAGNRRGGVGAVGFRVRRSARTSGSQAIGDSVARWACPVGNYFMRVGSSRSLTRVRAMEQFVVTEKLKNNTWPILPSQIPISMGRRYTRPMTESTK